MKHAKIDADRTLKIDLQEPRQSSGRYQTATSENLGWKLRDFTKNHFMHHKNQLTLSKQKPS